MPNFTLYDLNPEFWTRVQTKAKAEGTTVKAVILHLLTQWLGVAALVLFTVGCHTYVPDPLAPSPVAAVVEPTPTPAPTVTPLSVSLSIGRNDPTVGDNISFVASAGTTITHAAWSFGNGATSSTNTGDTAYAYPATGTFLVRVTVTASDGRTGSDSETVTVRRRETPPSTPTPPAPPPHVPAGFLVSLSCAPEAAGTATPCNIAASYHDETLPSGQVTNVDWDWGDGFMNSTAGPVSSRVYAGGGPYTVFAIITATTSDGAKTATASKAITIP